MMCILKRKQPKKAPEKYDVIDKSLRTKSLKRARNIKQLNAGTPHDWEDLARYQKNKETNQEP